MKTPLKLVLLTLIAFTFGSCRQSEIPNYDARYNAVRFPYRTQEKSNKEPAGYSVDRQAFLVSYSFFGNETAPGHTLSIPLYLIGYESDQDRQVRVEPVKDEFTAPLDGVVVKEAVIPAKSSVGHLLVEVKNLPVLRKQNVEAVYRIVSSDDLQAGPLQHSKVILSWGIRLPQPTSEDYIETYNLLIDAAPSPADRTLDYFSLNALEVIVHALGWTDWDSKEKHGKQYNTDGYKYLPYVGYIDRKSRALARTIDDYIREYNTKNPDAPLVHDGGKLQGQPIRARLN